LFWAEISSPKSRLYLDVPGAIGGWHGQFKIRTDASNAGLTDHLIIDASGHLNSGAATIRVAKGSFKGTMERSTESSGTLTTVSANTHVACAGGITLPNSVFNADEAIVFSAGGANRTFTRDSGIAMYLFGADVASATLPANTVGGVVWTATNSAHLVGAFQ
jgi:hypothetical protein